VILGLMLLDYEVLSGGMDMACQCILQDLCVASGFGCVLVE